LVLPYYCDGAPPPGAHVIGRRRARTRRIRDVRLAAEHERVDARAFHLRMELRQPIAPHPREIERADRRRHARKLATAAHRRRGPQPAQPIGIVADTADSSTCVRKARMSSVHLPGNGMVTSPV